MDVTLLITTFQRSHLLARSLDRLAELTLPDEIIVVDDGGDDHCEEVCASFEPLPIRYVWNNNPGWDNCCLARNIGVRMASYDEIITSEPEGWFVTDIIAQLKQARLEHPDEILSAEKCYHAPDESATLNLEACNLVPAWPYINMWRKPWLVELGGWDEAIPEDWAWDDCDLYERMLRTGHSQFFVPGLSLHHQWHPSRICPAVANEAYVRGKEFPRDLVANQGYEWGRLRTLDEARAA